MKYLITILLCLFMLEVFSQEKFISIEGTIKEPGGNVVEYATVKVKRAGNGTSAYSDGKFKLSGVKIGDTLLFTKIGYKPAYFVIDRKYNKLDFILAIDTLNTSIKMPFIDILFYFSSVFSGGSQYLPIRFSEKSEPVLNENRPDDKKIFTKVEVAPTFSISKQIFTSSLDSIISKLPKKYRPKKNGIVSVFYWIRRDKKIEVTSAESFFSKEVNNIFISFLEQTKTYKIFPAIQNGRHVPVFCVTKFKVGIKKDKSIGVEILQ